MDESKRYQLGGKTFWVAEDPTFRQRKWLYDALPKALQTGAEELSVSQCQDIIRDQGARICAVLLIEDGQTQAEKCRGDGGWEAVLRLEEWLATAVPAEALNPVLHDFFVPAQLGRLLASWLGALPLGPRIGLSSASPSLPAATSANPNGSGATLGSASAALISSIAGSSGG